MHCLATAITCTLLASVPTFAQDQTIVETADAAEGFETLVAAIKAAGLEETLNGPGPFTVFAPTDDAFKKLPQYTIEYLLKEENKDKLIAVLTYHVVPEAVTSSKVVTLNGSLVETVEGRPIRIRISGKTVRINHAKVVTTDIACSNGIIHAIDTVLLPIPLTEDVSDR